MLRFRLSSKSFFSFQAHDLGTRLLDEGKAELLARAAMGLQAATLLCVLAAPGMVYVLGRSGKTTEGGGGARRNKKAVTKDDLQKAVEALEDE